MHICIYMHIYMYIYIAGKDICKGDDLIFLLFYEFVYSLFFHDSVTNF